MYKILFSHSYFLRFDPKQWELGQPYPPLGTLYAASVMKENGYEISLFDSMFAKSADDLVSAIRKHEPDLFVIYDDGFNYLTKMCLTNMREAAFRMIELAKSKGCKVIVSSSDSTDHYEKYLQKGADFILMGEAEMSLLELVNALQNDEPSISQIEGLAFHKDGELIKTGHRSVMRHLDSLPYPAWDLIDIEPYRNSWREKVGYFSINMGTTRGCPFKCNWCAKPIYGNRYNVRSPQNVIGELKLIREKFEFDHIWFCDDIFGLKPGWVHEFADLLKAENLSLRFKIQARADLLLQEDYIQDLARAGCESVWMGAESGSQKILDAMDKGTTVSQIYEATRLLKKHGIRPCFFIQFGYLDETREDIDKTIKMVNELLPAELGISVSYPLPGTKFYEKVKADLKEKANWTDSDELMLMFRNTYKPGFYKKLHRYVHHDFRKHHGLAVLKKAMKSPFSLRRKEWKTAAATFWYAIKSTLDKHQLKRYAHE